MEINLSTLGDNPCNVILLCMLGTMIAFINSGNLLVDTPLSSDLLEFDRFNVYLSPLENISINVLVLGAVSFIPYGICKLVDALH